MIVLVAMATIISAGSTSRADIGGSLPAVLVAVGELATKNGWAILGISVALLGIAVTVVAILGLRDPDEDAKVRRTAIIDVADHAVQVALALVGAIAVAAALATLVEMLVTMPAARSGVPFADLTMFAAAVLIGALVLAARKRFLLFSQSEADALASAREGLNDEETAMLELIAQRDAALHAATDGGRAPGQVRTVAFATASTFGFAAYASVIAAMVGWLAFDVRGLHLLVYTLVFLGLLLLQVLLMVCLLLSTKSTTLTSTSKWARNGTRVGMVVTGALASLLMPILVSTQTAGLFEPPGLSAATALMVLVAAIPCVFRAGRGSWGTVAEWSARKVLEKQIISVRQRKDELEKQGRSDRRRDNEVDGRN